jgi:hypothetical protein
MDLSLNRKESDVVSKFMDRMLLCIKYLCELEHQHNMKDIVNVETN